MKNLFISVFLTLFFTSYTFCQNTGRGINPSYRYVANPGFVNITDINGATIFGDPSKIDKKKYFGVTNVFGYQIDRNFFAGFGAGYYFYNGGQLIPLYLEYKYSVYLRSITPYFFGDGGLVLDPSELKEGSKIFINPGIGFSRSISPNFEGFLAAGFMVQKRTSDMGAIYLNIKLGIIFRKNSFRLFKPR